MILSPPIVFKDFTNNGQPLAFGTVGTFAAGTNTALATYTDSTGTQVNTNPVTLNARGEAQIWLDASLTYKFVVYASDGTLIRTVDNVAGGISQAIFNALLANAPTGGVRTAAEIANSVFPPNLNYPPGNVLRYGTNLVPGTTDMAVAINSALLCNSSVFVPPGTYFCSTALSMTISGQTLYGAGKNSVLTWSNPNISNVSGNAVTGCKVNDLSFVCTGTGGTTTVGAVQFIDSTDCTVEDCFFTGMNWAGVWLEGTSKSVVRNNHFSAFYTGQQGCCDVFVSNDTTTNSTFGANYNVIDGNECHGGGWYGIALMQYYSSNNQLPSNNTVSNNRISAHLAYGILNYLVQQFGDCYNQIIGNYIENIDGAVLSGNAGAGIYIAGVGGDIVVGNSIRNCCISTSSQTLTPAGIGLNLAIPVTFSAGIAANATTATLSVSWAFLSTSAMTVQFSNGEQRTVSLVNGSTTVGWNTGLAAAATAVAFILLAPTTVSGNTIAEMQHYFGIEVSGGSASVTGNTITFRTGTPTAGILLTNADASTVSGNIIRIGTNLTGTTGIQLQQGAKSNYNNAVTGNTIVGCASDYILVNQVTSGIATNLTINGNNCQSGVSGCIGLNIQNGSNVTISGNSISTINAITLSISAVAYVRVTGNILTSTGTSTVLLTGSCNNGYFDKTNLFQTSYTNGNGGYGQMTNSATSACLVETHGVASPTTGTWAVGDRIEQYLPVVGNPKGWRCTVAGTSGTWVSEGNL